MRGRNKTRFEEAPWQGWPKRARAAGVDEKLIALSCDAMRCAYEQNWDDQYCLVSGWRFDPQRMSWFVDEQMLLRFIQSKPRAALSLWDYLLKTRGGLDKPMNRPAGAWHIASGVFEHEVHLLRIQRGLRRQGFLEVGDVVAVFIAESRCPGVVTAVDDDGGVLVSHKSKQPNKVNYVTFDLVPVAESKFRERRKGGREATIEVLEIARANSVAE